MRMLMWLGLAVLVYLAIRKSFKAKQPPTNSAQDATANWSDDPYVSDRPPSRSEQGRQQSEAMLSCEHCHVYFPASEAVLRGTQQFCSIEHADAGSKPL